jgi:hypothetical protein
MPTNTVMFAVRIGVVPQDADDLKRSEPCRMFKTTSLSNWGDQQNRAGENSAHRQAPDYQSDVAYFQTVADLLAQNPPPADHEAAIILLRRGNGPAKAVSSASTTVCIFRRKRRRTHRRSANIFPRSPGSVDVGSGFSLVPRIDRET